MKLCTKALKKKSLVIFKKGNSYFHTYLEISLNVIQYQQLMTFTSECHDFVMFPQLHQLSEIKQPKICEFQDVSGLADVTFFQQTNNPPQG